MCTSATTTDPSATHRPSPSRRQRLAAALLCVGLGASLSGCYVGVGYTWTDDDPPSVSLAASPTSAAPGSTISLAAAANDDDFIERVEFFRMSGSGATYLGSDRSAPYSFSTVLPDTSASSVSYFARAVDSWGQSTDSEWVGVTVLR